MSGTAPVSRRPEALRRGAGAGGVAARLIAALFLLAAFRPAAAVEWPPITPGEKAIESVDPQGPGALILFEEALVDDRQPGQRLESIHRRLKILTPAGLGWALVTTSLEDPRQRLTEVEGRTIRADGREVPLNPSAVSRTPAGGGRIDVSFRLPEAEVGAILEYRYVIFGGDAPQVGGWVFQHEVPCRRSTLTWRPSLARTSRWTLLDAGDFDPVVEPVYRPDAPDSLEAARFEIRDLPRAVDEPWGPPLLETRPRVVTSYTDVPLAPRDYWSALSQAIRTQEESFVAGRTVLAARLRQVPPATDDLDGRIKRAYDFAQTAVENRAARGEPAPPLPATVDSLLAAGVAGPDGVNMLCIAALAEFGIPATRALVVDRDRAFFHPDILSPSQFTGSLVAVKAGPDRILFLAPGSPSCPPGLLPWSAQGVTALLFGDSAGALVPTPVAPAEVNQTRRRLDFRIDVEGRLEGSVEVELTGQPELEARQLLGRSGPEALRREIESRWRAGLSGARVDSFVPLREADRGRDLGYRARLQAGDLARRVEGEILLNAATLARVARNPLGEGPRAQPVELDYPRIETDEARFHLPPEWLVENLPDPVVFQNAVGEYRVTWFWDGETLRYQRTLALRVAHIPVEDVSRIRELLDHVVQGDATLVSLVYRPLRPSRRN